MQARRLIQGLKGKSVLALLIACAVALTLAAAIGVYAIRSLEDHMGQAYAKNVTLLNKQRILVPVLRELALARRLANSEFTRQWLLDPTNLEKKRLFFIDAEGYRADFAEQSIFAGVAADGQYYYNQNRDPLTSEVRRVMSRQSADDVWFYKSLNSGAEYNLNVDVDKLRNLTNVWFNVLVAGAPGAEKLGVVGTALNLSNFVAAFVSSAEPGIVPIIFNQQGAIQAHPNPALIAFNSGSGAEKNQKTIFSLLASTDQGSLQLAMQKAEASPLEAISTEASMGGKPTLVVLSYIPELKWHIATAADLRAVRSFDTALLTPLILAGIVLLAAMLIGFAVSLNRLVLTPLSSLTRSAESIAGGRYDVQLPAGRADEIGDLTRAFGSMASQVRDNTLHLEDQIAERTKDLLEIYEQMSEANKKLSDSIEYASLIQQGILPQRRIAARLGANAAVCWQPRDVVGGDFYVFYEAADCVLFGVVDCAGHGVPGACMTMLAHAAFEAATKDNGIRDPGLILRAVDLAIRNALQGASSDAVATVMDVGLVVIDWSLAEIRFAGAKLPLFHTHLGEVSRLKSDRRAIGDRRPGSFATQTLPLVEGDQFTLSSDGYFDQAGGERGFGFGEGSFAAALQEKGNQPVSQQVADLSSALSRYRGPLPQRDDVTVFAYKVTALCPPLARAIEQ